MCSFLRLGAVYAPNKTKTQEVAKGVMNGVSLHKGHGQPRERKLEMPRIALLPKPGQGTF